MNHHPDLTNQNLDHHHGENFKSYARVVLHKILKISKLPTILTIQNHHHGENKDLMAGLPPHQPSRPDQGVGKGLSQVDQHIGVLVFISIIIA